MSQIKRIILIIFINFTLVGCNVAQQNKTSVKEINNKMMTIKTFSFNHFSENTYLLYDDTKEAIVIDPGCFFDQEKKTLETFITDNNLILKKIVFTHCHLDHAFGTKFIVDTYPSVELVGHKDDNFLLVDAINQSLRFGIKMEQPPSLTIEIKEGDIVKFGKSELKTLHVPGHSPGSICYYSELDKFVIVGDVLFSGSIGRTDLPGGNHETLIKGIKEKLLKLPEDYKVYSGHGPTTTIGTEKKSNPFLH